MNESLKLLAIFPHPDDETLGLGSTLARYSSEGVETYLICATRGERGWFDSEGPNPGLEGVAKIREAELSCAAGNLGLTEVNWTSPGQMRSLASWFHISGASSRRWW